MVMTDVNGVAVAIDADLLEGIIPEIVIAIKEQRIRNAHVIM